MDMNTKGRTRRIYLIGCYNFVPKATEPYFGKAPCECCKSELAGDRYEFTATVGTAHRNERVDISCCVDCFMYLFT